MVIANLDGQVEKVFGLSVQKKRAEQINESAHTDQATETQTPVLLPSAEYGAVNVNRAAESLKNRRRTDDESLDDASLPIWLL